MLHQADERQRMAAARLAQTLHLDPALELIATDSDLAPITLFDSKSSLFSLIAQAMAERPDRKQSAASIASARATKQGAVYGPIIQPSARRHLWADSAAIAALAPAGSVTRKIILSVQAGGSGRVDYSMSDGLGLRKHI